ncbi:hypothetical protein GLOIN_2v1527388 [Rhizophagus irregularis DAOM 181602=DAOM 197198]|uniref:Uncharacterized protein n=1 Tax=Rhizophagus irregularis (strain DAOM 181602 / DAOM 197198 / MUCL 43194) TaxID=747089 RepID=A0A2P4QPA8_RHIID|nr:hypothetical protein GLOIN_2v1527388 [Rhizophagus irregularis DAOM 181602=DAOM 197198]POG79398.1 hypothetical protein GLOIN_2v1527388 [Rhizophagus irregularis DAOM 181602=DAOM 197198]|eukprot:XP_025186264.1 hypothetical protein GLOIN_2v1527388 [Rhizophagus irregularis DAOM 181602=DAOM 197198]
MYSFLIFLVFSFVLSINFPSSSLNHLGILPFVLTPNSMHICFHFFIFTPSISSKSSINITFLFLLESALFMIFFSSIISIISLAPPSIK